MSAFGIVSDTLEALKCKPCGGTGWCDDNDGFGISCNEWVCEDCDGSGFRDAEIHNLQFLCKLEK